MNKNNNLEENNNELSFSRDIVTEMKLNKLINNFEIKNKINNNLNNQNNNYIQNQNEIGNNYNELKDLVQQSGSKDLISNK